MHGAMPMDLTVVMQDQPGELARVAEVAVSAGVHLRGLAAFTGDGRGFVHALVDDADVDKVRQALKQAKIGVVDAQEVLVADFDHRPGGLVDVLLALADANVNVELAYTALGGAKVVIATDDLHRARDALD
jgi:hypothetical protein